MFALVRCEKQNSILENPKQWPICGSFSPCYSVFPSVTSAFESCRNVYSQSGYALVDHAYKSVFTGRLASCYMSCNTQPTCQSLNYNLADKTCELNNDTNHYLKLEIQLVLSVNIFSNKKKIIQFSWRLCFFSFFFNGRPRSLGVLFRSLVPMHYVSTFFDHK